MPQGMRDRIIHALVSSLENLDYVNAVWQGGAAAFNRVDQWSDIDLVIDAADQRCGEVWDVIETALKSVSPIETCFSIPAPPLGLHSQKFYRLRDASPFLMVDIGVFCASTKDKLLDVATHGNAIVHFDRTGVTRNVRSDEEARHSAIRKRLGELKTLVPLFQPLVLKEINRGNDIEAVAFYLGWSVRPLVELLRIKHCPQRWQFHTRYIQHDLPSGIVDRLRPMFYLRDLPALAEQRQIAEEWSLQLLNELCGA
jgi:hypothetical protein